MMHNCAGCGRLVEGIATHCASCIRDLHSNRVPKWLREPPKAPLLAPHNFAAPKNGDGSTLHLFEDQ